MNAKRGLFFLSILISLAIAILSFFLTIFFFSGSCLFSEDFFWDTYRKKSNSDFSPPSIYTIKVFNSSESSRYCFYRAIISLADMVSMTQTESALKSNFYFLSSWNALNTQKQEPAFSLSKSILSPFRGTSMNTVPDLRKNILSVESPRFTIRVLVSYLVGLKR